MLPCKCSEAGEEVTFSVEYKKVQLILIWLDKLIRSSPHRVSLNIEAYAFPCSMVSLRSAADPFMSHWIRIGPCGGGTHWKLAFPPGVDTTPLAGMMRTV